MKLLKKSIKLFLIGIYIELLRRILSMCVNIKIRKGENLTSYLVLKLSGICNRAANLFLQIEKNLFN